ncbi:MAG: hypothetical protein WDM81_15865 [Rhizomicrobium sp.]
MKNTSPGFGLDVLDGALKLSLAAHQSIEMLVHHNAFELCQRRARDGVQRFAGGVGNQMDMELGFTKPFLFHPRALLMNPVFGDIRRRSCVTFEAYRFRHQKREGAPDASAS